ncbi:MAG: IS21-like element helper ATPase IstB [Sporocytophaga sp.]|nr:IS21-like element helper ATPase IstB [Sporocytophaga sp.]
MNQQTLSKLSELKLTGMHRAYENILHIHKNELLTADELVQLLVQSEWEERHNQKLLRLTRSAKFRYQAAVEEVTFPAKRNLDKNLFLRLADCSFIDRKENILITGATGVGKSFVASALGHQACSKGYRTQYFNLQKLFTKTAMAKADGTYVKELGKIEKKDILILDDFGLQPLDTQKRLELLEIIEDRHGRKSTIICSQLPVNKWYDIIEDSTIADAILDRLINGAHRLELKGESMRKK